MNPAAPPTFQPSRLVRWALFFPVAILSWVLWQLLVGRVVYGGVVRGGLTWVEGTAEAVFVLVASLIAPARKRVVATGALAFFVCRDIATVVLAPQAGTIADAGVAIALACLATAVVWWATSNAAPTQAGSLHSEA